MSGVYVWLFKSHCCVDYIVTGFLHPAHWSSSTHWSFINQVIIIAIIIIIIINIVEK